MQIIVKAHHVEITPALREYAEKKMEKLDVFFDHINKITVNLHVEAVSSESDRHVASALINMNGGVITAKEHSGSMYSSIDMLLDKLTIQLKRYKEKLKNHRGPSAKGALPTEATPSDTLSDTKHIPPYVKKPMEFEDAIQILESRHLSFLVYHNFHERVCVVYDDDGCYRLIET